MDAEECILTMVEVIISLTDIKIKNTDRIHFLDICINFT